MKITLLLLALAGIAAAQAKQGGAPKQPPAPPLLACGQHGDIEIICGTRSPEDLEPTPDGKFVIVAQFVAGGPGATGGTGGGMGLFDPAKKTFTKMTPVMEPLKEWGDASCPGPIGDTVGPHGLSLSKRKGGKFQLYVVNHVGRESIEMYEVRQTGGVWSLAWHGCVVSKQAFNDVAALEDGGFVATHPTALQTQGTDLFAGGPSGFLSRWVQGKGEEELPGTRAGYPNGVISDGRYAYYNAWTAKEVHKYDLKEKKETAMVKLDFMPDNLSWTKSGKMLSAGVKGARGDCPAGSGAPCIQGFGVAELDKAKLDTKTVFDSQGKGALISGVSIALQVGNDVYVGAFQGDRLVKFKR